MSILHRRATICSNFQGRNTPVGILKKFDKKKSTIRARAKKVRRARIPTARPSIRIPVCFLVRNTFAEHFGAVAEKRSPGMEAASREPDPRSLRVEITATRMSSVKGKRRNRDKQSARCLGMLSDVHAYAAFAARQRLTAVVF
ncbi:uncharacterized protein LOC143146623 [Ptiloglossa arizonensis]|uniref:uncharacterized protein LOC143146623 n=1 Tax=Ptiloglossa arizonensis TaxID=3350558 RepID=UPI003FA05EFD